MPPMPGAAAEVRETALTHQPSPWPRRRSKTCFARSSRTNEGKKQKAQLHRGRWGKTNTFHDRGKKAAENKRARPTPRKTPPLLLSKTSDRATPATTPKERRPT